MDLNDKIYSKVESTHSKTCQPELLCTEISDDGEPSQSTLHQPNSTIPPLPMEEEMECTQKILEIPATVKKKVVLKKGKKKAPPSEEQTMFQRRQAVLSHPLIQCLLAYWDAAIVVHALELVNRMKTRIMREKLKMEYTAWTAMKTVLKLFVTNIKKECPNLEHVSVEDFKGWLSSDGFCTIYGNVQTLDSIGTFDNILFETLSDLIVEQDTIVESYSSQNTTNTSMLCTTVPTQDAHAVADTSKPSKSTKFQVEEEVHATSKTTQRAQKATKRKPIAKDVSIENDSEESEDENPPPRKKTKKVSFKKHRSAETENESGSDEETPFKPEAFDDMVDAFMQAASTASTIGRISQSISLESRGDVITLTSPGERGHKVIKLEIYDFHECCRSKPQGLVEESRMAEQNNRGIGDFKCDENGGSAENNDHEQHPRNKKFKGGAKTAELEQYLNSFIITPPQNIIFTKWWIESKYKYWNKNDAFVKNCFHNQQQKVVDMTVRQIFMKTRTINIERFIIRGSQFRNGFCAAASSSRTII